jgi:hypothetical protein
MKQMLRDIAFCLGLVDRDGDCRDEEEVARTRRSRRLSGELLCIVEGGKNLSFHLFAREPAATFSMMKRSKKNEQRRDGGETKVEGEGIEDF